MLKNQSKFKVLRANLSAILFVVLLFVQACTVDYKNPNLPKVGNSNQSVVLEVDGMGPGESRVFLSEAVTGDLKGLTGIAEGTLAADQICNNSARSAHLVGNYKAVLSSSNVNANTRFNLNSGPFFTVATNGIKNKISDGSNFFNIASDHQNPIDVDASGNPVSATSAWTGSDSNGDYDFTANCNDWSTNSNVIVGAAGSTGEITLNTWLAGGAVNCDVPTRLYCVFQNL